MMNTLVIYVHPWDGSFSRHVLSEVTRLLANKDANVDVIDLYKDGFNPVMTADDLRLFSKGEYFDPLAKDYVLKLKKADELVLIFPIWWYGEPAMLKGFYDKVLLKGHTYDQVGYDIKPVLNIPKVTILTTGTIDENYFAMLGDPINNRLSIGTLQMVGITNPTWIHCPSVHEARNRETYLRKISAHFG